MWAGLTQVGSADLERVGFRLGVDVGVVGRVAPHRVLSSAVAAAETHPDEMVAMLETQSG
jgi:hypothetical protein